MLPIHKQYTSKILWYTIPMSDKKIIIANWKMNPATGAEARKMWNGIARTASKLKNVETIVCPPLVYLESLGALVKTRSCVVGAQDAFWEHDGAYTGQVSPDMIFNARGRYVIVGHSERRGMGETDEIVNKKIQSILKFPLIPIVCVGEIKRDSDGEYTAFLKHQLRQSLGKISVNDLERMIIAYEPVWAIGTKAKRHCTPAECREAIHIIRQVLADIIGDATESKKIPVIYGGSADATDAQGYLDDGLADGLLVGHASLDPKEFIKILKVAESI